MKRQRLDDEEEAKGQVNDKPAAPTIATQNASSVKQQNIPKPHPSHHHRAPTSHNSIIPDSLNFPSIFKHDSNYDDICLEVTNLINKHLNGPNGQYLEVKINKKSSFLIILAGSKAWSIRRQTIWSPSIVAD